MKLSKLCKVGMSFLTKPCRRRYAFLRDKQKIRQRNGRFARVDGICGYCTEKRHLRQRQIYKM